MQRFSRQILDFTFIFAAVALIFLVGMFAAREDARETFDNNRQQMRDKAASLSIIISTELSQRAIIGDALAVTLSQFPNMPANDYASLAVRLRGARSDVLNIAAAPDLVVRRIYPIEPNSSVLGLDYRKPSQFSVGVEEAMAQKSLVVVGPIDLVQGGRGLILRVPVFAQVAEKAASVPWGIVSVVVDADAFFTQTGIKSGIENTEIAVRRMAKSVDNPNMIYGVTNVFSSDAVVVPFRIGNEIWQLGLLPIDGWPTTGSNAELIWIVTGSIALAIAVLLQLLNQQKQKSRRAQQQLLDAIEAIDDGFALYDSEDRLVMCNSRYREIYGKSADLFQRGRTFREIIKAGIQRGQYPDAIGREEYWLEERMDAHLNLSEAVEQKLDDGTWLKIAEKRMNDGSIVGFRVDITDLKNARDTAEALSRATTEFLNNINHEIRTPLTVIAGFVSFLAKPEVLPSYRKMQQLIEDPEAENGTVGTAVDAYVVETKAYAERIQLSLQHLLGLVRDTLDFSKIQNGDLVLRLENVDLGPILHECAQQFSHLAEEKGLQIRCSCEPLIARSDPSRLRQILINVVGNAIKYTKAGSVELACRVENGFGCITVTDTGCGVAKEHQQDIFKKFWQADGSVTREHGGTGLGLAISRNLVELLGGKIELRSNLGEGSTFTIWVPLTK